mmetsp:Transcript_8228/g.20799  ORF Transcript_8228/g.20799 Transcript_8228/m.20799 type:complete len:236 (+) Transcript_8228:780-1487(+)
MAHVRHLVRLPHYRRGRHPQHLRRARCGGELHVLQGDHPRVQVPARGERALRARHAAGRAGLAHPAAAHLRGDRRRAHGGGARRRAVRHGVPGHQPHVPVAPDAVCEHQDRGPAGEDPVGVRPAHRGVRHGLLPARQHRLPAQQAGERGQGGRGGHHGQGHGRAERGAVRAGGVVHGHQAEPAVREDHRRPARGVPAEPALAGVRQEPAREGQRRHHLGHRRLRHHRAPQVHGQG